MMPYVSSLLLQKSKKKWRGRKRREEGRGGMGGGIEKEGGEESLKPQKNHELFQKSITF